MTDTNTLNRVERACAQLHHDGHTVTFTAVAARTGLGRSTLYRDPTIRAVIETTPPPHRRQRQHRRTHRRDRHPPHRTSTPSPTRSAATTNNSDNSQPRRS